MVTYFEMEIKQLVASAYSGVMEYSLGLSAYLIIKIPDKKLAFHLVRLSPYNNHYDSDFFCGLTDYFASMDYRLVHIWEDLWVQKRMIMESRIRLLLGNFIRIHARKTDVYKIDKPILDAFLTENHLYGSPQCKYKYGLYEGERLVAVASFSAIRTYWRNDKPCRSAELVRYASLNGYSVAGGLSRLLIHFIRQQQPNDVMSYADRDWSDGKSYERLGFKRITNTLAQCFWIHPAEMVRYYPHRLPNRLLSDFQQQGAVMLLDDFLLQKGYIRIYNTGNIKYLLTC